MPNMVCKCGHRIGYGEIPCRDEWLFISDTDFDRFAGKVEAESVYSAMSHGLKCPVCSRLWLFMGGFSGPATEYVPADCVEQIRRAQ